MLQNKLMEYFQYDYPIAGYLVGQFFQESYYTRNYIYNNGYYTVTVNNKTNYGKLFYSEVKEMSQNLEYEIEKIQLFDDIPDKLTYPEIQPYLYKYIVSKINRNRKEL